MEPAHRTFLSVWRKKNIFILNFVLVTDGEDEPEGVRVRAKDFGHVCRSEGAGEGLST